ncbi:hypothetical protein COOONC_13430 [Cooperia oncophora]
MELQFEPTTLSDFQSERKMQEKCHMGKKERKFSRTTLGRVYELNDPLRAMKEKRAPESSQPKTVMSP